MYTVKRMIGGFAVIEGENPHEKVIQRFDGKGAKARAEARAAFLNGEGEEQEQPEAAPETLKTGRGNRGRGAYRGQ